MNHHKDSNIIAVLGGTGALGMGLALRWCLAGHQVIIGSRAIDKAQQSVSQIKDMINQDPRDTDATSTTKYSLEAKTNKDAAQKADIAVLAVPFAHQADTLREIKDCLRGKLVIDVTVPLVPPKVDTVQLPEEGSAALRALSILGKDARLVSAFQNVAAKHLVDRGEIDCDVLVSSDDAQAAEIVITLIEQAGMRGFYAGPLKNSVAAEALTSVLIHLNKRHRVHSGIRITGIAERDTQ